MKLAERAEAGKVEFFVDVRDRVCRIAGMSERVFTLLFLPSTVEGISAALGGSRLTVRGSSSVVEGRLGTALEGRIGSVPVRTVEDLFPMVVQGAEDLYVFSRIGSVE